MYLSRFILALSWACTVLHGQLQMPFAASVAWQPVQRQTQHVLLTALPL
jgi:hypothetical protein